MAMPTICVINVGNSNASLSPPQSTSTEDSQRMCQKKATRENPKILKRAAHTISEIKTIVREAFAVAVAVGVAVGVRVPSRNMALTGKALNQMSLALGLSGLRSCAS